eukprot:4700560-Prymnesium_polylepis.2
MVGLPLIAARRVRTSKTHKTAMVRADMSPQSSVAQLASRPVVAYGAIAIALKAGITTTAAWAPAPVRLAAVRLDGCHRVAPIACREVECRNGGVGAADGALNRFTWQALACRRVFKWSVFLFCAHWLGNGRPQRADETHWAGARSAWASDRSATGALRTRSDGEHAQGPLRVGKRGDGQSKDNAAWGRIALLAHKMALWAWAWCCCCRWAQVPLRTAAQQSLGCVRVRRDDESEPQDFP